MQVVPRKPDYTKPIRRAALLIAPLLVLAGGCGRSAGPAPDLQAKSLQVIEDFKAGRLDDVLRASDEGRVSKRRLEVAYKEYPQWFGRQALTFQPDRQFPLADQTGKQFCQDAFTLSAQQVQNHRIELVRLTSDPDYIYLVWMEVKPQDWRLIHGPMEVNSVQMPDLDNRLID